MTEQAVPESAAQPLGLGPALRQARELKGLSITEVAAALRMPSHVIEHLEAGQFNQIGASVFVRGYVRSYGRFLGLPDARCEVGLEALPVTVPALASRQQHSRLRVLTDRYAMRSAYVVLTLAIVLPALYVATHYAPLDPLRSATHSLDADVASVRLPAPEAASPERTVEAGEALPTGVDVPEVVSAADFGAQPVMASMAPFYRPLPDVPVVESPARAIMGDGWSLQFLADSWVEIVDRSGNRLVYGMVRQGETLSYPSGAILRVALGNASGVRVSRDGVSVDLTAYRRANVARFAVSSAGELEPVGG